MIQKSDNVNAHFYFSHEIFISRFKRKVFRKRKTIFMNKINELINFTNFNIYMIVRFYDRFVIFVLNLKID